MTKQERLHRQDPKRAEPIRNMTGYLRNSHSWGETPPGEEPGEAGGEAGETLDDVLTDGVNLGYKIIDKHILQGRRAAEALRSQRLSEEKGTGSEANALVSRLLGVTRDMGSLWLDSLEIALRSPRLLAGLAGGEPRHADGAGPAAGAEISVEIASARRTQVTLSLPPGKCQGAPQVHALHAANPAFPPLAGVSFQPGAGSRGPVLVVEIPDAQPPSTYTGVVVEQDTNEPVGTLVVRVLA
jgi:hypothetical protein